MRNTMLIICLSLSFGLCAGKRSHPRKELKECPENIKLKHKIAKKKRQRRLGTSLSCRRNLFGEIKPAEIDRHLDELIEKAKANQLRRSPDDDGIKNDTTEDQVQDIDQPCRYFAWDGQGDDDEDPSSYGMLVPVH